MAKSQRAQTPCDGQYSGAASKTDVARAKALLHQDENDTATVNFGGGAVLVSEATGTYTRNATLSKLSKVIME